jgi:polyisoprenoid-binding protein YceI
MKIKTLLSAVTILFFSSVAVAETQPGQYAIDTSHSAVLFTVDHLGYTKTAGRFNQFEGSVEVKPNGSATLELTIKSASVDSNHEKRDDHLRSPDFLNAKQFPELKISGEVDLKKGDEISVDVTLLGVTKAVTFEISKGKEAKDPWGNDRVGYTASAVLKRSDFGMNYMLGGIGDEIEVIAYLEALKQ